MYVGRLVSCNHCEAGRVGWGKVKWNTWWQIAVGAAAGMGTGGGQAVVEVSVGVAPRAFTFVQAMPAATTAVKTRNITPTRHNDIEFVVPATVSYSIREYRQNKQERPRQPYAVRKWLARANGRPLKRDE